MSKLFDAQDLSADSDTPIKLGYRQLRLLHSFYIFEYKISPIKSKELESI